MPGQINRTPDGVMGFLGIKNFGRMPDMLNSTLAGTWELAPWYLNVNCSYQQSSLNGVVIGPSIVFTVPNNEIWYVTDFSMYQFSPAAAGAVMALVRFGQRTADYVVMGPSYRTGPSQAAHNGITRPFILGAGESLGWTCAEITVSTQAQLFIRYRPMQV